MSKNDDFGPFMGALNLLGEIPGWQHNFHKKIPGLFQDFSRKITLFSRIISKDRKLAKIIF